MNRPGSDCPTALHEPFRLRFLPDGLDGSVPYERGLLQVKDCLWVVVREARSKEGPPVLHRCFEGVANAIRQELVHLKGYPDELRFFHLYYEMTAREGVRWNAREVLFVRRDGQYTLGTWVTIRPETWAAFNAAWSLAEQPPSRLP